MTTETIEWCNMIVPVYEEIPEGWAILKGATNHPKGMRWIHNRKSLFDKERRIALLKTEKDGH